MHYDDDENIEMINGYQFIINDESERDRERDVSVVETRPYI